MAGRSPIGERHALPMFNSTNLIGPDFNGQLGNDFLFNTSSSYIMGLPSNEARGMQTFPPNSPVRALANSLGTTDDEAGQLSHSLLGDSWPGDFIPSNFGSSESQELDTLDQTVIQSSSIFNNDFGTARPGSYGRPDSLDLVTADLPSNSSNFWAPIATHQQQVVPKALAPATIRKRKQTGSEGHHTKYIELTKAVNCVIGITPNPTIPEMANIAKQLGCDLHFLIDSWLAHQVPSEIGVCPLKDDRIEENPSFVANVQEDSVINRSRDSAYGTRTEIPFKRSRLNDHSRPNRSFSSLQIKSYQCSICQRSFTRQGDLKRHQRKHSEPEIRCLYPDCNRAFYRKDKLEDHWRRKHEDVSISVDSSTGHRDEPDDDPDSTDPPGLGHVFGQGVNSRTCKTLQSNQNASSTNSNPRQGNTRSTAVDARMRDFAAFNVVRKLGQGGSGSVYEIAGFYADSDIRKNYACKILKPSAGRFEEVITRARNEISMLKRLDHPNIIKFASAYVLADCVFINTLPVADCNLKQFLCQLSLPVTSHFKSFLWKGMRDVASALAYVHNDGRIFSGYHGDIKPENILVESGPISVHPFRFLLADFGSSKFSTAFTDHIDQAVTPKYCPPEWYTHQDVCGQASDVWAFGCVLAQVITCLHDKTMAEFETFRDGDMESKKDWAYYQSLPALNSWLRLLSISDKESSNPIIGNAQADMVLKMLLPDPKKRPRAAEVFASFDMLNEFIAHGVHLIKNESRFPQSKQLHKLRQEKFNHEATDALAPSNFQDKSSHSIGFFWISGNSGLGKSKLMSYFAKVILCRMRAVLMQYNYHQSEMSHRHGTWFDQDSDARALLENMTLQIQLQKPKKVIILIDTFDKSEEDTKVCLVRQVLRLARTSQRSSAASSLIVRIIYARSWDRDTVNRPTDAIKCNDNSTEGRLFSNKMRVFPPDIPKILFYLKDASSSKRVNKVTPVAGETYFVEEADDHIVNYSSTPSVRELVVTVRKHFLDNMVRVIHEEMMDTRSINRDVDTFSSTDDDRDPRVSRIHGFPDNANPPSGGPLSHKKLKESSLAPKSNGSKSQECHKDAIICLSYPGSFSIDVFVVHCLKGNFPLTGQLTDTNVWLKDLFTAEAPQARVFTMDYSSTFVTDSVEIGALSSLQDAARHLLNFIQAKRKGYESKPACFICHSFGGLVVKLALLNAHDNPKLLSTLEASITIIFLGTSDQGSSATKPSSNSTHAINEPSETSPFSEPGSEALLPIDRGKYVGIGRIPAILVPLEGDYLAKLRHVLQNVTAPTTAYCLPHNVEEGTPILDHENLTSVDSRISKSRSKRLGKKASQSSEPFQGNSESNSERRVCQARQLKACWQCRIGRTISMRDYTMAFSPDFLTSHFRESSISGLIHKNTAGFTENTLEISLSSGPDYPCIKLTVHEFLPTNKEFLTLPYVQVRNGSDIKHTFETSYALPLGIHGPQVTKLKDLCLSHIEAIVDQKRDIGEATHGDTSMLSWEIYDVLHSYWKSSKDAGESNDLLHKAMLLHAMHYFMSRLVLITNESAQQALKRLTSPHILPFQPAITSMVLNLQLKQTMQTLLTDTATHIFEELEDLFRLPRPKSSWAACLCIFLILCICTEAIQVEIDSFVSVAIRRDASSTLSRIEICRNLDNWVDEYIANQFHSVYKTHKPSPQTKTFNPLRDGIVVNEGDGITQETVDLVNNIQSVIRNHKYDMEQQAQPLKVDSEPDPLARHMTFRKRNSGRLVASFLKSFFKYSQ